jgi:hypothetical protein
LCLEAFFRAGRKAKPHAPFRITPWCALLMRRRSLIARTIGLVSWLTLIVLALVFLSRWKSEASRHEGSRTARPETGGAKTR